MSKAYSPTENLFALLALADEPTQKESKPTTAPKKNAKAESSARDTEPTPAARAEAKKQQEAEARAKQKADEERKAAEAERQKAQKALQDEQQKAFDLIASTGFSKQRAQAKKEAKRPPPTPAPTETTKQGGKGGNNKKFNDNQRSLTKDSIDSANSPNNSTQRNRGNFKGDRPFKAHDGQQKTVDGQTQGTGRPPKREYDRHSGTGMRQGIKRHGQGKHNWDDGVAAGLAVANESVTSQSPEAQSAATDVQNWNTDDWDNAPVTVTTTTDDQAAPAAATGGEAPAAEGGEAPAGEGEAAASATNEPKELSLDEYLTLRAEKMKELEAKVKPAQPRTLTEAEKQSLTKFNVIENEKNKKPEKSVGQKASGTAPTPAARKGQTPVALEAVLKVQSPPRGDGPRDGPRFPRGPRTDGQQRTNTPNSDAPRENNGPRNTGAPRENRGPPRQRNQNYNNNNNSAQNNRGPRDNRPKKGAPQPLGDQTQFPSLC